LAILIVGTSTIVAVFVGAALANKGLSGLPRDEWEGLLTPGFILNVVLVLFGWRQYRKLQVQSEERALTAARARRLAMRDSLTGFHNRRSLAEAGAEMLARANHNGRVMTMLLLDVDHFKNVNDIHGHAVGDGLLRSIAAEMSRIAPPGAIMARLGGDEFACAFEVPADDAAAIDVFSETLVNRLSQPLKADGTHIHTSISLGIAISGPDCDTVDQLLRRADIAMYEAKQRGRNGASWFNQSMERALKKRSELETKMRHGIPAGEFEPYFEQQVDLATGALCGFEVLARWHHDGLGPVSPTQFIPIAEETGLIGDLCFSVVRKALIEARDWDPSLTISVNIAPIQLRDPWLAQKLVKLLVETSFPAHRLEIEITETGLFDNLPLAQSIVGGLKNQGIRLALDDFGTGYSSLAHLRALPFDRIKIDKSFVMSLIENQESAAIVNAIARLGENLSLPVTAEGIERQDIADRLRDIGINKGQGWLYGRPMPIATVRRLLADRELLPAEPTAAIHYEEGAARRIV
jgi:diguanylate cyclase (GGDEF)-like protein